VFKIFNYVFIPFFETFDRLAAPADDTRRAFERPFDESSKKTVLSTDFFT
jgi:hypothetical protein